MKHAIPSALLSLVSVFAFADAMTAAAGNAGKAAAGLSDADKALSADWVGKVSLGLDSRRGNTDKDAFSAAGELAKLEGDWVVRLAADGAWEETTTTDDEGVESKDQTVGNAHGNANVKRRFDGFFFYADFDAAHDATAGLKYRLVENLGLGTYLVDTDEVKFFVEAGPAYVEEKLDETDDYFALSASERCEWRPVGHPGVAIFEDCNGLWDMDDSDRYVLHGEAGVDVPVLDRLSLTVKGVWEYTAQPAAGKEKEDRQILTQLSYVF